MTLTEIIEYLFVANGQYVTGGGTLESVGLTNKQLWIALRPVIELYQKYMPLSRKFNLVLSGTSFDFTDHEFGVPEFLSEVIPLDRPSNSGGSPGGFPFMSTFQRIDMMSPYRTTVPEPFPYRYVAPTLYLEIYCRKIDVMAHYNYAFTVTGSGEDIEVTITDLDMDKDNILLDLLSAKFLQAIGKMRRSWTYADLAITNDAATLVEEGKTLEKDALDKLHARHPWHWGVHV